MHVIMHIYTLYGCKAGIFLVVRKSGSCMCKLCYIDGLTSMHCQTPYICANSMVSARSGAIALPLFLTKRVKVCNEPAMFHCCCAFKDSDQLQSSVCTDAGQYQPETRYAYITLATQIGFRTRNDIYCTCMQDRHAHGHMLLIFRMEAEGVRQQNVKRKDRFKENALPDVPAALYQPDGFSLPK